MAESSRVCEPERSPCVQVKGLGCKSFKQYVCLVQVHGRFRICRLELGHLGFCNFMVWDL